MGFTHLYRMRFFRLGCSLLLGLALWTGCSKQTGQPSGDPSEPTHAQPKLKTMKLYVGTEALDAELALTEQQERTGMMFRTNIQDGDSMLFVLPYTQQANFWMLNCPESISAAYINPDGTIAEIHHLEKNDTNGVSAATANIRFVLETSDGWFQRHHVSPGAVILTEHGSLADTFNAH